MAVLLLIIVTMTAFTALYLAINKLDDYLYYNMTGSRDDRKRQDRTVRISTESPFLAGSVAHALEMYTKSIPDAGFTVKCSSSDRIIKQLERGKCDLVLLGQESCDVADMMFSRYKINYRCGDVTAEGINISCDSDECSVYVLWNEGFASPARDNVLFYIRSLC